MVDHLATIESQTMELGIANREHLTGVANQLLGLDVSL